MEPPLVEEGADLSGPACGNPTLENGNYRFAVTVDGREDCVDQDTGDSENIQHTHCSQHPAQNWRLEKQGNGCYLLKNANTGTCLALGNGDGGDSIKMMACNDREPKLWRFDPIDGGQFQIANATRLAGSREVCLDQRSQEPNRGGPMQTNACNGTVHQRFYVRRF
ncbi:MAG: RICIN domain-containing protein [Myxococcales bacterium]|nr:RICIN domain-containing protein [Myxococcales bacterium]